MKLTLESDDNVVWEEWTIEEDFGDVTRPLPRALMINDLTNSIEKLIKLENQTERNAQADLENIK